MVTEATNQSDNNDHNNGPGNPLPLEASREELVHCQFHSWFPTFRHVPSDEQEDHRPRSNVTIKSKIISPLPADFADFLLEDGIRLPEGATKLSSCAPNERPTDNDWDDDDNEADSPADNDNDDDSASSPPPKQFAFPELNQQIQDGIAALGGSVMPKLNWSAPKDATWVNEGTLKCKTPGDVYLLLKSSDFCLHDLQVFQSKISKEGENGGALSTTQEEEEESNSTSNGNSTPLSSPPPTLELVLRKWCNFYPSMEFRCFVRNHVLIGISQRNHSQHYPHLLQDKVRIRSFLLEFFDDVICHRFANNQLANYVFDVYVDKSDRVWLVDFNVWSIQTDALMYTWEELVDLQIPLLVGDAAYNDDGDSVFPELRVVETALEVRHDPLSSYRAPMDTVTLASASNVAGCGGGAGPTSFESFMAMCQKPSELGGDETGSTDDED